MCTAAWKSTPPAEPGLYIASAGRRAGFVRYWSGQHWTAPVAVWDAGRALPDQSWPAARDEHGHLCRVEWLEPFTQDAAGFIAWSGSADTPLSRGHIRVRVLRRNGASTRRAVPAGDVCWRQAGRMRDVVGYQVVEPA